MTSPQAFHEVLRRWIGMNHIVNCQVRGVAREKTSQQRKRKVAEDGTRNHQQKCRDGDAQKGRHRQPVGVFWIFMVNAMHDVLKTLSPFGGSWYVKKESMYVILDPGEDEETDEVQDGGRADANRRL